MPKSEWMSAAKSVVDAARRRQKLLDEVDRIDAEVFTPLGLDPAKFLEGPKRPVYETTNEEVVKQIIRTISSLGGEANTESIKQRWDQYGRLTAIYVILSKMCSSGQLKKINRVERGSIYQIV